MRTTPVRIGQYHFEKIERFPIPSEVSNLYRPSDYVDLLVRKDRDEQGRPTVLVYVPRRLWCTRGNPIHLDFLTEPEVEREGFKKLCAIPVAGFDTRKYTPQALLNMIDQFFARYPSEL